MSPFILLQLPLEWEVKGDEVAIPLPPCGFFSFSLHFLAHFRLTFSLNIEQQQQLLHSLFVLSDGKVSGAEPSIGCMPVRWKNACRRGKGGKCLQHFKLVIWPIS